MENNIDTNTYYVNYRIKGCRTFSKRMPIRISAELGRRYLKGELVVEELQNYIIENVSYLTNPNDIIILSVNKILK